MQRASARAARTALRLALALRAYLFLGAIEAAIAMAAFFFVLHRGGWHYGQTLAMNDPLYLRATTACFSAIVVLQIVNVFLCRSATRSIFSTGMLGNPLIWGGVMVEIALVALIDYTRLGNSLFGTAPIGNSVWRFPLTLRSGDADCGRIAQMDCTVADGQSRHLNPRCLTNARTVGSRTGLDETGIGDSLSPYLH